MLNNEISSGIYVSACKSHGNDWSLTCLQPFKPQTKPNRFVIRIESFTWLQAAAIPPEISSCGLDPFFLPTLKIIEPKKYCPETETEECLVSEQLFLQLLQ